jgi:hypothetical protein
MLPKMPPATRFGRAGARRIGCSKPVGCRCPTSKAIRRQVPDVTINDVFMAVVGGALNSTSRRARSTAASMLAGVPMTLRGSDKTQDGNRIGFTVMPVLLGSRRPDRAPARDPGGRRDAKRVTGAIGKDSR